MPAAKPPPRKKAPETPEPVENTDPGGPAPDVLAKARKAAAPAEPAPVQPGPGDATLVYDKNKGRARVPASESPRLTVTAGPRKGADHTLVEEVTTIGRGSDNVLVIPDISVSRQHSRVEKQGERWVVLDQGSGNGTRVNGKPIERYPLQHGDEIEMGDTKLKFVEPGGVVVKGAKAPTPQADDLEATENKAPPKSNLKKRGPLYAAIAVGLAIVFAAGMVRRQQRLKAEAEAAAQGDESRELAQKRFQEGVALLKQGKWVEARDKLKIAAELDAQDPEIKRYLESAENEAPRAQQLAIARAALQRKDYAGARAALAGVPDDSALADGAHEIATQIKTALDAAVRDARVRAEAGDAAAAQEVLLEPVLAAEPSRSDALAVKEAIGSQRRSAPAPERRRERAPDTTPAPQAPDVQSILEAYLSGDIGAAIQRAQDAHSPKGERLLGDLREFDAAYKEGLARQQAKRNLDAIRSLEQAASADRSIAQGREGRLGREVKKALSSLHYQVGASMLSADDASLPQAASHLRTAVQDDSSNDAAQAQLRQIVDRCKEIYLRGYVAKDEDAETARKAFKLVIETLPPTDETAQKAKRWLDKLNGKVSSEE